MQNLTLIYYSPTGTTKQVVRKIGKNTGLKLTCEYNIASNKALPNAEVTNSSLTIIGLPVYAGRLPITVIEALKKLKSNQSPVVIVVVYGNRAYEDSLLELKEIVSNCGFNIIAGAAFIGEHSFSTNQKPIAQNRPDKQDLEKCREFAHMVCDKLKSFDNFATQNQIDTPGNIPYRERKPHSARVHPKVDNDLCTLCGICVESCPVNAIIINEMVEINGKLCTLCCACVKSCPEMAISLDNIPINKIRDNLFLNCSIRKEPVYFL